MRRIAGKRYPTILRIPGGPVSQYQNEFDFQLQTLAGHGYLVVVANPRGSSGRGERFSAAIFADWGNKDAQDVLAAVDYAVAQGLARSRAAGRRRVELRRHPHELRDRPGTPLQS